MHFNVPYSLELDLPLCIIITTVCYAARSSPPPLKDHGDGLLEASIFSPGLVGVVVPQDLEGHPRLPQKHILGQVPVVPQVHSADTQRHT